VTYAANTSRRTDFPFAASARYKSYPDCMSIHSLAGVPRLASSRNAVSGLMPRLPATISWMRCGGTRSLSAKALELNPRASSFSLRIAPGWICSNANWLGLDFIANVNTVSSSLRAQRGNPDFGAATGLPRRYAPRNDEVFRAFAPSREPNLFLLSREAAKARREKI
jgi:hypothetical protein